MMPWTIPAWPHVVWSPKTVQPQRFTHLSTQVLPVEQSSLPRRGQTIWWANIEHGDGAIAWDWIEVRNGLITMLDPMTVISNIDIDLDNDGEPPIEVTNGGLTDHRMIMLNAWVHEIEWQPVVRAALKLGHPQH